MRVIAGRFRGRTLAAVPKGGLRPTSDPVREALFNLLGDRVPGHPFLDLCAGTGAVGIEAASRGASPVVFVERDPRALRTLAKNLGRVGLTPEDPNTIVARGDVGGWIRSWREQVLFDAPAIAFLDPPYGDRRLATWARSLSRSGILPPGSLVVLEHRAGGLPEKLLSATIRAVWSRRYGDTALTAFEPNPA